MATTYEVIADASNVDQKTIRETSTVATADDFTIAQLVSQIKEYRAVINSKIVTHNALIDKIAAAKSSLKITYTIPYAKITAIK